MKRKASQQLAFFQLFPITWIISFLCAFIGGLIGWTAWITKNVPQTDYVDALFTKQAKYIDLQNEKAVKYIDDKITAVRAESFAHSDFNRSSMESEYKGLTAKIDMLILMIQGAKGGRQ